MRDTFRNRTHAFACTVVIALPACAAVEATAPSDSPASPTLAPPSTPVVRPGDDGQKAFSGEIIYRQTAVPRDADAEPRDLGDLHYFISGAHWKHVDETGVTTALYDPQTHLIHYFKPRSVVDATVAVGTVKFEALPDTKVILGRQCKAARWVTSDRTVTIFYDPDLFVDPTFYEDHHFGHWAETLKFLGGALALWSKTEVERGDIIAEAIGVRSREFDAPFWQVPETTPDTLQ